MGVRFSSERSRIMRVKRSEDERQTTWRLERNELEQTVEYKYLWVWIDEKECNQGKYERISMKK